MWSYREREVESDAHTHAHTHKGRGSEKKFLHTIVLYCPGRTYLFSIILNWIGLNGKNKVEFVLQVTFPLHFVRKIFLIKGHIPRIHTQTHKREENCGKKEKKNYSESNQNWNKNNGISHTNLYVCVRLCVCVRNVLCVQVYCTSFENKHTLTNSNMLIFYYRIFKWKKPPPPSGLHTNWCFKSSFLALCFSWYVLHFSSLVVDANKFFGLLVCLMFSFLSISFACCRPRTVFNVSTFGAHIHTCGGWTFLMERTL